jgi:transposase
VDKTTDKDTLIETLLQERDELYQELSRLRQSDGGTLEHYEAIIEEKDNKIRHLDGTITVLTIRSEILEIRSTIMRIRSGN